MATTTAVVQMPNSLSKPSATTALVHTPTSRPTASTTKTSPSVQPPITAPAYPPSPGTWRHPKLTEIARRQSAATFSGRDLRRAVSNAVALFLSFLFTSPIHAAFDYSTSFLPLIEPPKASFYTLNTIRLCFLYNLAYALLPLLPDFFPNLTSKDQITDIPLTPSQRYLLGLDPSVPSDLPDNMPKPASADASPYITPPRYRRSSGSSFSNNSSPLNAATATDRRSISATYYSSSPLSTSRNFSPSSALSPFRSPSRGNNGSPFSPSASPLLHKAIAPRNNNNNNTSNNREVADLDRRRSLGISSSGLGRSQSLRERGAKAGGDTEGGTDSPSPSGRPRRHPHLNYKWLYEKGARLPKSETMQF